MTTMAGVLRWWRFAAGFLGGRLMLAMMLLLLPATAGYLMAVVSMDVKTISQMAVALSVASMVSGCLFLGAVLGAGMLQRSARQHPAVRLVPSLDARVQRLMRQVLCYAALALPLAVVLRVLAKAPQTYLPGALLSFAGVGWQDYAIAAAWLLFCAALIAFAVVRARLPLRYAWSPVYFATMPFTGTRMQVIVGAGLLVLFAAWWVAYRWSPPSLRSQRKLQPRDTARLPEVPQFAWARRLRAWRLRRATRQALAGTRGRAAALVRLQDDLPRFAIAVLVTLLYCFLAGSVSALALPSFWFLTMTVAIVTLPNPQPIGRLLLLPRTATRASLRGTLLRVWLTAAWSRLALAMALWLAVNTVLWAVDWRPFNFDRVFGTTPTAIVELLWRPLAHGVAIAGSVAASCLLLTASPLWLMRGGWLFAAAGSAAALSVTGAWSLWRSFGADDATLDVTVALLHYAAAAGLGAPALAGIIHLALAPTWRSANLAQLAAAMRELTQRLALQRSRGW